MESSRRSHWIDISFIDLACLFDCLISHLPRLYFPSPQLLLSPHEFAFGRPQEKPKTDLGVYYYKIIVFIQT